METENAPGPSKMASNAKAKRTGGGRREFQFCSVCRCNHDQGNRHRYFPGHVRALTTLLSRFHRKISDLRSFVRNPSLLLPEHDAALNRLWCIFCSCDLHETDSLFARSNAIRHLASSMHLLNLKNFLEKHGGGMDRVDSFRVSEADLVKWEKGCEALKGAVPFSCNRTIEPSLGSSKDIQHAVTSNIEENSVHSTFSYISDSVIPLQNLTNENYVEYHPKVNGFPISGSISNAATSCSISMEGNDGLNNACIFGSPSRQLSVSTSTCNVKNVIRLPPNNSIDKRIGSAGDPNQVLPEPTLRSLSSEVSQLNVHAGGPPPWFEISEGQGSNVTKEDTNTNTLASQSFHSMKSKELNPKRVGAAWAERRRAELKMEKREIVSKSWLPNFGSVWQEGTRKKSRKEFEMRNRIHSGNESPSEISPKVQPYISKRHRSSDLPVAPDI
ncbi:TITAN-like protein [Zingiber officinale]|uniref:TITAN-like protein n=1 Tax=Zingiber officinale TaxID=94328 RepID=UPI001C4D9624|nr:TITAN-like protein [Zingiber officinale]